MIQDTTQPNHIIRNLDDKLTLRQACQEDAERLSEFNAKIHSDQGEEKPDEKIATWTNDLLTRPHPTFNPRDFTIVEDRTTGQIVSSLNLISQTWSYEGIPFKVGRPELVGTAPDYRNRGLVRAQFDMIHQWSLNRGEMVQAITGIPFYYRLYGYEMALDLGGGRLGFLPHAPELKEKEEEPYLVRPAIETDLAWIATLYDSVDRSMIKCLRDEQLWRYELAGRSELNANRSLICVIENRQGEAQGYLIHPPEPWGPTMLTTGYEINRNASWRDVTPSVIRYLIQAGTLAKTQMAAQKPLGAFGFWLGREHPVYEFFQEKLPRIRKPYAWYIRVPDLPGFIQHLTPVINQRMRNSDFSSYSGELKLTFYTKGLYFKFENGQLITVEQYKPSPVGHRGDAAFPGLTFLQLLFGYRTLDELAYAFPDCWWENDESYLLLNNLFPKKASNIWPIS